MSIPPTRTVGLAILVACALLGSACTTPSEPREHAAAETIALTNQWATSIDTGKTAVFGTLSNGGHQDARVVGGSSPLAGSVEVYEALPDATGAMTTRPTQGGLVVPAGETRELIPGGDHLMLMDLSQPLDPGSEVPLTVMFDDDSSLTISVEVRDLADAGKHDAPAEGANGMPHHHG